MTYYECESCEGCPFKRNAPGQREPEASGIQEVHSAEEASLERITSPMGILLRMNRSIQAEGAFGTIKQNYGFRQFLLRGNKKVSTEILVLAMAYNINKLHSKIQQNRMGTQLFEKDSA